MSDAAIILTEPEPEERDFASEVVAAIDVGYANEKPEKARSYIGASGVGDDCTAALAFSLRGFPSTPAEPRLKRIFRDGHRIEREVIYDLKKAGYRIWERDELTGRQHRWELAGGHVVCNIDGIIALDDASEDDVSLLEIKSMNKAQFNKFQKHRVKVSHKKYWDQMQMMMGMSGLPRCLFIAYCKDTSEYACQVVEYDEFEWAYSKAKIVEVFEGEARKISDDPTSFLCKFCFRHDVCWNGVLPEVKCQSCSHSTPTADGKWWCGLKSAEATASCDDWDLYKPKDKR